MALVYDVGPMQTDTVSQIRGRMVAAGALVLGALCGIAGSFAPDAWRPLAWAIDGTALIVGAALLAVHHVRRGNEVAGAGFLVFVAGQTLVLSGSALSLEATVPSFAAGAALWAAALAMISATNAMPSIVRLLGAIAALLMAIVSVQVFSGTVIGPLTRPLPFFAYPFLAATIIGWAWTHARVGSSHA